MPWDDWRKDFNKKLDDFGEDAKQKYRQQREANAGGSSSGSKVGLQDRMNMLKGENPRWNRDVESRTPATAGAGTEHTSTVVPERSRVPPAPPSALNKGRPPPPPSRHSASNTSAAAPPPALPARMQNEDGTNNPPPPYPPATQTQHAYPTSQGSSHIEFSRFTHHDKQAFFHLLDEYFDQRERGLR
ncbi:Proline-rich protein [Pseudozyma hubeiensis]|nr:Proline-rich protein [Pseudozyma hubeiensis]